jgi:hypothetical protein
MYEINVRCYIQVRWLINRMESAGLLSRCEPLQVGAFSTLMQPILQVGLDNLVVGWNHVSRVTLQACTCHPCSRLATGGAERAVSCLADTAPSFGRSRMAKVRRPPM